MLVVADKYSATLAEPGQGSLDDPPPWLAATGPPWTGFSADRAKVHEIAERLRGGAACGIIVSLVEQQMFFLVSRSLDHDRQQRIFQTARVMPIGRRGADG